jgi:hypothetical protein
MSGGLHWPPEPGDEQTSGYPFGQAGAGPAPKSKAFDDITVVNEDLGSPVGDPHQHFRPAAWVPGPDTGRRAIEIRQAACRREAEQWSRTGWLAGRQIPPRQTQPGSRPHPVHDLLVFSPPAYPLGCPIGQKRLEPRPILASVRSCQRVHHAGSIQLSFRAASTSTACKLDTHSGVLMPYLLHFFRLRVTLRSCGARCDFDPLRPA